ncbi:MAG: hypothetical protein SFU83_10915 [Meiothermus sp.]|nr:hypothetical protein [Meiothermus sp.]
MEAVLFLLVGTLLGVFGARLLGLAVVRFGPWWVLGVFSALIVGFAVWQGRPALALLALVAPVSFGLLEWRRKQIQGRQDSDK